MASTDTEFDDVEVQVVTFSMQQSQMALGEVLTYMPKQGDVIIIGIEQAEEAQLNTYLAKINPFMTRTGYTIAHSSEKKKLAVFVYKKKDAKLTTFKDFSLAPVATATRWAKKPQATTSEIILEMKVADNRTPFFFVVTDLSDQTKNLTTYIRGLQTTLDAQNPGAAFCICGDFSNGEAVNKSKDDLKLDEDALFINGRIPRYRVEIKKDTSEFLNEDIRPEKIPDRIIFCMSNSHRSMTYVRHQSSGIVECQSQVDWAAGAGSKHYAVFERFTLGFAKWSDGNRTQQQEARKDPLAGFGSFSGNQSAPSSSLTASYVVPSYETNVIGRAKSFPVPHMKFDDGTTIHNDRQFFEKAQKMAQENQGASDSGPSESWEEISVPGLARKHINRRRLAP